MGATWLGRTAELSQAGPMVFSLTGRGFNVAGKAPERRTRTVRSTSSCVNPCELMMRPLSRIGWLTVGEVSMKPSSRTARWRWNGSFLLGVLAAVRS